MQEQQAAHEKQLADERSKATAEREQLAHELDALRSQVDERARDSSRVHDTLCEVRAQLAQVHTQYENMYEAKVVPAQVRSLLLQEGCVHSGWGSGSSMFPCRLLEAGSP